MKTINTYIIEKLHISKNKNYEDEVSIEQIIDYLKDNIYYVPQLFELDKNYKYHWPKSLLNNHNLTPTSNYFISVYPRSEEELEGMKKLFSKHINNKKNYSGVIDYSIYVEHYPPYSKMCLLYDYIQDKNFKIS